MLFDSSSLNFPAFKFRSVKNTAYESLNELEIQALGSFKIVATRDKNLTHQ